MRLAPTASARRYLYELLTGCALVTAPPPYRLSAGSLGSYNDFALGIPASLATALAGHARHLLDGRGIGCEPLQWQPPDEWVTATAWPGADPARTGPAARYAAPFSPAPEPATRPPGQQPGVIYLDPAWLRREYLTWHRSLDDIAAQIGCPIQILNRFARDHGIPVRTRGTSSYMPAAAAPGIHARDLPEPLRSALTGPRARGRLEHLLVVARHPSIRQAAQALGIWQSTLYQQVARLERACGGPLINRAPRPAGTGILTPLGQRLCQQAREHLSLQGLSG